MVNFPTVAPTSASFTAPEFPVRANTSLSGIVSRRLFGNRGSRSVLNLSYENVSDSIASQFLNAWNTAKGTLNALTVTATTFSGASAELLSYLSTGGDALTWHFAEPPEVQRIKPGISSVRVTLEATRDI